MRPVALGEPAGRPVVVSGGGDRSVWDVASGTCLHAVDAGSQFQASPPIREARSSAAAWAVSVEFESASSSGELGFSLITWLRREQARSPLDPA